jgi:mannosyltransferase
VILALAVICGGAIRFGHLASRELSADEAASWAAAAAPTVADVARLQGRFNPGKLPLYEIVLHFWIVTLAGDGVAAMRALSSAFGTIAIVLVFLATRELFEPDVTSAYTRPDRDMVAALGALVFAVNLVSVKYARDARVYSLQLALVLGQVAFFLRAMRRSGWMNWTGAVLLTGLAMAANFTTALVVGSEVLWLFYLLTLKERKHGIEGGTPAWQGIVALACGLALLAPFTPMLFHSTGAAFRRGAWRWIAPPPWWEPFAFFNKATGTFAYPVMLALAAWGGWRGWSRHRRAVEFALVWMLAPVIAMMVISYGWRPAFVERYALSCFVPFFVFVALGLWELRSAAARWGALALVVVLALGHVATYDRKPHDYQWREAAQMACATIESGELVSVAPGYAVHVVRYYLPRNERASVVRASDDGVRTPLLVLSRQASPSQRKSLIRQYPRVRARLRGLSVRER